MKKCPICKVDMERVQYENFQVDGCPQCGGNLLRKMAFEGIKRNLSSDPESLATEAAEFQKSNPYSLACPSCLAPMSKKIAQGEPIVEYDLCSGCHAIWLDAGELAMLQQAYENSPKGQSAREMHRRHEELESDPVRKTQFQEDHSMGYAIIKGISEGFLKTFFHRHGRW